MAKKKDKGDFGKNPEKIDTSIGDKLLKSVKVKYLKK